MEDTRPKAFVFVLMPFHEDFNDVYQLGIKAACENAGAYCERVDEQIHLDNIMQRVYNQIAKADIIVAEMTGRNPNVFYEVGYAHALNQRVILITQDAKDIPFDLIHYPHIVYGKSIAKLKSELERKVCWCIQNPQTSLVSTDVNLEFFINGQSLSERPTIEVDWYENLAKAGAWVQDYYPHMKGRSHWGDAELTEALELRDKQASLTLAVHNPTVKIMDRKNFGLAFVVPSELIIAPKGVVRSAAKLQDGRYIYSLELDENIILFADGWTSIEVSFLIAEEALTDIRAGIEVILRSFTEVGPRDYPFIVKLKQMVSQ